MFYGFPLQPSLSTWKNSEKITDQNVKHQLRKFPSLVLQKHLDQKAALLGEAQKHEFHPFAVF